MIRPPPARCIARASPVDAAHSQYEAPVVVSCPYDGSVVVSPGIMKPSLPYTPFQLPCVTVSVERNTALALDDAAPAPPTSTPLTTALGPATLVTRTAT